MILSDKIKEHNLDIDIMRIIASFFVIMIHSSDINSFSGIFYNSISRFSVPVFFIISGSYMLSRKRDSRYLSKKIGKLFVLMIAWSGIYYIYYLLNGIHNYNGISDLLSFLLTEPIHLWYIYATIALYMFTPIFYIFSSNASKREYLYALILTFLFGSVVVIALRSANFPVLSVIIDKMKIPYTLGFVFLYLLGGYLQNIKYDKYNKYVYILGIIGTITTIIGTLLLSQYSSNNGLLLSFFAPNVLMAGVGFYLFIKQSYMHHPIKNKNVYTVLHNIANCTLSIYLLHPLLIIIFQKYSVLYFRELSSYIAIPLRTLLIFTVSTLIVFILKKIPCLKLFL